MEHLPADKPVEIWFQDEARIGQKNGQTYQWAAKGTRPRQPADQRYENAYIFGAVCPERDKGAALVMPYADTDAMQKHLEEISRQVAESTHAALVMDGAGWHKVHALKIPENITIIFLPPYSPKLNPVENIWQFLRQNYLSNRIFKNWEAISDACCDAWNKLINEEGRIKSITTRNWAIAGQ